MELWCPDVVPLVWKKGMYTFAKCAGGARHFRGDCSARDVRLVMVSNRDRRKNGGSHNEKSAMCHLCARSDDELGGIGYGRVL